jgi:hypothetical protein
MNRKISGTSFPELLVGLDALAIAQGWPISAEYQLAGGQLSGTHPQTGQPWAIRIDAEAPALHAQIATLEAAAETAQAALPPTPEQIWWDKLAGTISDGPTGIVISASEPTRIILTGQLAMVSVALQVGAITPSTPQDIWDSAGTKHTLPTSDLIALLLRHGQAWAALFAEFAP